MSPRVGLDRDQIIQTAARLADEGGLQQVTIANLAQELGVRPPSLYNHVKSLHEIHNFLAMHALNLLLQQLLCVDREHESASSPDARHRIHALGQAYLDFARNHPGLYEVGLLRARGDDHPDIKRLSDELVGLFISALSHYHLQDDEGIHAVRGLRCLLHGFATLEQQGGFGLPVDVNASFTFMIDKYLTGLQATL